MKKIGIVMSVVLVLSVFLVSGAYAQSRAMDRGDYNYRYQMEQQRSYNVAPNARGDMGYQPRLPRDYVYPEQGTYYYEPQPPAASPAVPGVVVGEGRISQQQGPAGTLVFESVVPPPTRSDILSERINRKHNRPAQVYVETDQGVPTRFGQRVTREGTARGYYPQTEQTDQGYRRPLPNQSSPY